jgi:hypothetical protein
MPGFSGALTAAARDYRWLLDRGYAPNSAGKLVGDRHRLDAEERLSLFRGVASREDSATRLSRRSQAREGDRILLDGYNVAFTIVHYILGKPCFLSSDGFLRDAGANYGRVPREEALERALREIAAFLSGRGSSVEAFFDAPVSRSGAHAGILREALATAEVEGVVEVVRSADGAIAARLLAEPSSRLLVASSDSAIIARSERVWDLARSLLETNYNAVFPDFGELLGRSG